MNPGGSEKRQEVLQSVKGGDNSKDFLEVGPDLGLKVEWAGRGMHGNKDGESTKHGIGSFLPCVEHAWSSEAGSQRQKDLQRLDLRCSGKKLGCGSEGSGELWKIS